MDAIGALEREARGGRTANLFRDVNERLREINAGFSELLPYGDWACECADETCNERVALTPEEYEAVRIDATHFVVAPSPQHVAGRSETVVERTDRYWVVEK